MYKAKSQIKPQLGRLFQMAWFLKIKTQQQILNYKEILPETN